MALYPFLLEPIYKEKVWGGRSFERFGRTLPGGADTRIGESWELADLDATSPSGGGGAAAHSRIRNGPLIDRTVGEVARDFGALVTGGLASSPGGRIPLLVKYLDARENLSVQVHPSPDYAAAHPEAHLKSEAWYVIHADPGAVIYKGVSEGTTPERFRAAVEDGSVVDLLETVPAVAGSCHYLPSGTCHALGAGVVVAEVQTPSDTTFRVFDWGRTDRELHLEEALECIEYGPCRAEAFQPGTRAGDGDAVARHLVRCEHFAVDEWSILREGERILASPEMAVLMILEGEVLLHWGQEGGRALGVAPGDTVLVPAALERLRLEARTDVKLLQIDPPVPGEAPEEMPR